MCLLLIEDSVRLRESLAADLKRAGHEIEAVGDVQGAFASLEHRHHDVILLDIDFPDTDWLDLLGRIRVAGARSRIILLTPKNSVADRVRGLNSGADDCLPKPFSFDELLARVHAMQRSRQLRGATAIRVDDLVIDPIERRVMRGGIAVRLTRREFEILEYLARHRGETVSQLELEDHLYGPDEFLGSNTISSAICLLRKKLGTSGSKRPLVHTERGKGYCLGLAEAS